MILLFFKISFSYFFNLYFITWRLFSLQDIKKLLYSHIFSYTLFGILYMTFLKSFIFMPRSAILIDFFLSIIFIGGFRISKRFYMQNITGKGEKPAILIGANSRVLSLFNEEIPYRIKAIFDNDKNLINTYIGNFKIYPINKLEHIIEKYSVEAAIITKEFSPKFLDKLFLKLNALNVREIKLLKFLEDRIEEIKDISIEDLLARKPKDLDIETIREFINNRTVLVTGAGGSIGSEICRQSLRFNAKKLILIDNSEYNLYRITEELSNDSVVSILESVVNREMIFDIIKKYSPDIIIHAAAYKHVPLVEKNIKQAVINNIVGTKNVLDAGIENNVRKIVLISSDKAVNPTSVMGATKRVCELYAQNIPSGESEISVVRFGNVLGSSGSVVPKFIEQIKNGGPITVTHPEATRFFMLIPEACQLVLQAAAIAKGGEIFILDMGEPVKILDLAKKLLKIYNRENNIDIVFTGLRPGEKLYEEILIKNKEKNTKYQSIYIAKPTNFNIELLKTYIGELTLIDNDTEIIDKLKEIIPEFNPTGDFK